MGALISLDAIPLVWFRMSLAAVFIGIYVAFRRIKLRVTKKLFITLVIAGGIIALHWITFFMAIKVSNVSVTLATISTGAFFTAFLEPIFYKRKMVWYEIMFGLIVIAGLYIIFNVGADYKLGIILALVSALLSSIFSLINGKLVHKLDSTVIGLYEITAGVLLITGYLFITKQFTFEYFQLSTSDWMYMLLLSSICTAFAIVASVKVMKLISPYTVMLTINLEPIYGIFLAYLIFGDAEKMSPGFYVGGAVILATVLANGIMKNTLKRKTAIKQDK